MSIRALHSAASGMTAQQFNLDVIANNMANSNTTGFKKSRASFEDVYYEHLKLPGTVNVQNNQTPIGIAVGHGVQIQGTIQDFTEGALSTSGNPLDLAIAGDGFFQVNDGTRTLYTRSGNFTLNSNGQVVLASADRGYLLDPPITVGQDQTNITVGPDGTVSALQIGQAQPQVLGNIQTAKFINPPGLLQVGENLWVESAASGNPIVGTPTGAEGLGAIRQRFLENSNVEPVDELVGLIKTQRTFELNSQVVQAADQALQVVNNLRRF